MTILFDEGKPSPEEFLHSGVKGMKWGVRRAQKKAAKADAKWEKQIYTHHGAIAIHNEVANRMNNGEIDKHNSNPRWKDKNLNDDPKLEKAYYDAYAKVENRVYSEAVQAVHGKSPSGSKQAVFVNDEQGPRIEIKSFSARHADEETEPDLIIPLKLDELGQVIEQAEAEEGAAHSDDYASQVIEHFGVKGMKWGRHKSATGGSSGGSSKPHSVVDDKPSSSDIRDARDNVAAGERAIRSQRKTVRKTGKGAGKLAKMEMDHLKNPDRVTALKMTDGEKLINTLFYGPGNTLIKEAGSAIGQHVVKKEIEKHGGKV